MDDLANRSALRDLVDGYADAADRRDVAGFTGLFVPDATLTVARGSAEPAVYAGTDRLAEIPERLGRYRLTLHVVTNHHSSVDGDHARGGAICQAHHLSDDPETGTTDLVLHIRYHDTYARTSAGWRFATRLVDILWTSSGPATVSV